MVVIYLFIRSMDVGIINSSHKGDIKLTYLIAFVFIVTLVIAFFFNKRGKKVAFFLLLIPLLMILGLGAWLLIEGNYYFVKDTDLSTEVVGNIELEESLKEYIKDKLDSQFTKVENVKYPNLVNINDVYIGADKNNKIIFVSTISSLDETGKHIKVSDSKNDVIKKYGESYYEGRDMGIGKFIAYVDRDSKRHIRFWLEKGKVRAIELSVL